MKLLIILTMIVTGSAHAFVSHEDYAITVEMMANKKLVHSRVECKDLESNGFYSCTLIRKGNATDEGYEYDYKFMRNYLGKINETVWDEHKVPELYIHKEKLNAKR